MPAGELTPLRPCLQPRVDICYTIAVQGLLQTETTVLDRCLPEEALGRKWGVLGAMQYLLPILQPAAGLPPQNHGCIRCQFRHEAWHLRRTFSTLRLSQTFWISKRQAPWRLQAATDHPNPEDVEDLQTPEVVSNRVVRAIGGAAACLSYLLVYRRDLPS